MPHAAHCCLGKQDNSFSRTPSFVFLKPHYWRQYLLALFYIVFIIYIEIWQLVPTDTTLVLRPAGSAITFSLAITCCQQNPLQASNVLAYCYDRSSWTSKQLRQPDFTEIFGRCRLTLSWEDWCTNRIKWLHAFSFFPCTLQKYIIVKKIMFKTT
jgi:hypothetical protein